MIDTVFFYSNGEIFFLICAMVPILFYIIWRIGYNLHIVKVPLLLSLVGVFYFFFTSIDFVFIIDDSLNNVFEKLVFFNLLFFSTIFTMIILVVPSNQNNNEISQPSIVQEYTGGFNPLSKWNSNKNKNVSIRVEDEIKKEEELIRGRTNKPSEILEEKNSKDEFQKFINNLFEDQHKRQK